MRKQTLFVPILLAINALTAYILITKQKFEKKDEQNIEKKDEQVTEKKDEQTTEKKDEQVTGVVELKSQPITTDKQMEIYQRILEEKRKIRPKDNEEKQLIDVEKAILKRLVQTKWVPSEQV